jgi:hypothetical protein
MLAAPRVGGLQAPVLTHHVVQPDGALQRRPVSAADEFRWWYPSTAARVLTH